MKYAKIFVAVLLAVIAVIAVFTGCSKETLPAGITKLSKAKAGDKVQLGSYEQDNNTTNGKEKITWIVLAADGNKALLISEKALETKQYNTKKADITWEKSSLRAWLNNDFFNGAFDSKEVKKILETALANPKNAKYNTPGGSETKDKAFILSYDEANQYFKTDEARRAKGTASAKKNGLMLDKSILYKDNSVWLLRSPGIKANEACYVNYDGVIYQTLGVALKNFGVRPAIWVKQ